MKIINLDQHGPQWLKWRQEGIGGSDAAGIMGDSPWSSAGKVIQQKITGRGPEETARMTRGKILEPQAREKYQLLSGIGVRPVCVVHDEYEWLRASLDGLSEDGETVLEIKCPGPKAHYQALKGVVPHYNRAQVQQQLLITGAR